MTTAPQIKKAGGDKRWLVKNEQGETFGPVDFETLKLWAKDGRLAPTNTLSDDTVTWGAVTQYPELEMDWVAEVSPGAFYGPIHKLALESLKKEGALPAEAVAFQRAAALKTAAKTQPVTPFYPVVQPSPRDDSEALRALERQLDLERQRSHDTLKQLQQVESRAAASEARAEASEKAHAHDALQAEQVQKLLTANLDQANQACARLQAQLRESAEALQRTEQRTVAAEKLEALIQTCLTRLAQQQEAPAAPAPVEPRVEAPSQQTPAPSLDETGRLLREALAEMQAQLAKHVTQQVGEAFTQTQQQMCNTAASAHEQVAQELTARLEQLRSQLETAVIAAQTRMASELNHTFGAELEKMDGRCCSALDLAQREATSQVSQAVTQAITPVHEQLIRQREEIERFRAGLNMMRAQTSESVVSAVAALVAKEHEELFKRIMAEMAAGHDQMFERTTNAMTHGRELMMRVTGESQRLSIEYIVRELTATMNQAIQAGRETIVQTMRSGWTDVKEQTVIIEAHVEKLQASQRRLELELKHTIEKLVAAAAEAKPVVERTYVKAEAVEVMPPERPRKKVHPEPEVSDPPPSASAGAAAAAGQGLSIADIEQQARRELERLGAQGMNIFKRKK